MRTILSTLLLSLVFLTGSAQGISKQNTEQHNYVVMTKNVQQIHPILLAAEELKKEDGENFGVFEVIVCGKNIGDLTDSNKIEKLYERAEKLGVSIIACGFSLNRFKVEKSKLPEGMRVVENGILHSLNLQKKNYYSLDL
ncbi:MAG TPA: hypothetical protein VKX30_05775 [Flavobacteriaceae bacterium]|nr:hypothetical protein [Flavobacteriaceae bacterium]